MGKIYHWIGFIIFWLTTLSVMGTVFYFGWLWFCRKVYPNSWLSNVVGFFHLGYLYHNKLEKINGDMVWGYDYRLRHRPSYQSQILKKVRLAIISQMLNDSESIKKSFDAENERAIKYATDKLIESGWENMSDGTWAHWDNWIVKKTLWQAFECQREWDKNQKNK